MVIKKDAKGDFLAAAEEFVAGVSTLVGGLLPESTTAGGVAPRWARRAASWACNSSKRLGEEDMPELFVCFLFQKIK